MQRTLAVLFLWASLQNTTCLTLAGTWIGNELPKNYRNHRVGGTVGLTGDVGVAVKVAGVVGGGYALGAGGLLFLLHWFSDRPYPRRSVAFPSYPMTEAGVKLARFVDGNVKMVLLVEEPQTKETAIREQIVKAVDADLFYNRADDPRTSMQHTNFTFAEAYAHRTEFKQRTGAELMVHMKTLLDVSCTTEAHVDTQACTETMIQRAAGLCPECSGLRSEESVACIMAAGCGGCAKKPTRKTTVDLAFETTLLRISTGEMMKVTERVSVPEFSQAGDTTCPQAKEALKKAVSKSVEALGKRISPGSGMVDMIFYRKDPNPDVEKLLRLGYEELDQPEDFDRAGEIWARALEISKGQSVGALVNLANYHVAAGRFHVALEHFQRISAFPGQNEKGWRPIMERVQAMIPRIHDSR